MKRWIEELFRWWLRPSRKPDQTLDPGERVFYIIDYPAYSKPDFHLHAYRWKSRQEKIPKEFCYANVAPKSGGGVANFLWGLVLSLLLVGAAWGQATAPEYQILLDTDNNPATGCTVATSQGNVSGIEQRLITTVAIGTSAAAVSGVQLQTCGGGVFGAAGWSDAGGWPVGIGNGTDGAAVIETYLPLARLTGAGPVRVGVISSAGQVADALTGGADGQPLVLALNGNGAGDPSAIPVLNPWTLGLLIALLGGALRWGRRWPGATRLLVLVVVMAGAGLAWAAFVRDGQTSDWAGVAPLASQTSTVTGPSKIVALFGKAEGGNLNFRIDAGITIVNNPYSVSTNSSDPLLLVKAEAPNSTKVDYYGERNSSGIPTAITQMLVLDNNGDEQRYRFDSNGRLTKIIASNGTQISLNWLSATNIAVTVTTPDGAAQFHTIMDTTKIITKNATSIQQQNQLPNTQENPLGSQKFKPQQSHGISQNLPAGSADVNIAVSRCGLPTSDVDVDCLVFNPQAFGYDPLHPRAIRRIPAKPIGNGLFSASIPNNLGSSNSVKEICQGLANTLSNTCDAIELGHLTPIGFCTQLIVAVTAATYGLDLPAVPEIEAACLVAMAGLEYACLTSPTVGGGPSLLDQVCNAPALDNEWLKWEYPINLEAVADCLPRDSRCSAFASGLNQNGPFPLLKIDLGSEPYIRSIKFDPEYPVTNQGYKAIADVSCVPANTKVDFSVKGTDKYEKSESHTQSEPTQDGNFTLSVPGVAMHGVSDVVTFTMTTPAPDKQTVTKQAFTELDGKLSVSDSSVDLSGKVGERRGDIPAFQIENTGRAAVDYLMIWDPMPDYFGLSPMSGVLQPQGSQSLTAGFWCPSKAGKWGSAVRFRGPNGKDEYEDAAYVTLTCDDCENKNCCGKCCKENELPPKCCPGDTSKKCSGSNGDPHLTTFDGLGYDFQAVGEFILAKSLLSNDTFEVQARHKPWGSRTEVSITQAVAMKVVTDRVGFYSGLDPALRINGTPTALAEGGTITLPSGGNIVRLGGVYRVSWPDTSAVDIRDRGGYLDVSMRVPAAKYGQIIGLLGNADSNTQNDVTIRNGASLGTQVEFKTLYPSYADSWRITQQESLFDYASGETTETFTDRNFPRVRATVADLTEEVRAQAEQICRAAGVTDPILLDNCILDVALTGSSEFAKIPADAVKPKEVVEIIAPPPPTINTLGFGQFKGSVLDAITTQALNAGQVLLTVNGAPLPRVTTRAITNGAYETDVVPVGSGYQLDIQADGYIAEKVFGLSAWDRQVRQVEPVRLVPVTAGGAGTISGHIGNALDNSNVPNLNVFARRYINQRAGDPVASAITNASGNFMLNLPAGNYTLEIQGAGYLTNYLGAISLGGQTSQVDGVITPELGNAKFRIVLTWGERPYDLDAHLTGPDGQGGRFHISYANYGNANLNTAPYAYLDRDDTTSFGPETITIGRLQSGGVYRYSVYDFSDAELTSSQFLAESGAQVDVYNKDELVSTFVVPNQPGTLWTVFEIGQDSQIIPVNQISYATNPAENHQFLRLMRSAAPPPATDYWQMLFQPKKVYVRTQ